MFAAAADSATMACRASECDASVVYGDAIEQDAALRTLPLIIYDCFRACLRYFLLLLGDAPELLYYFAARAMLICATPPCCAIIFA